MAYYPAINSLKSYAVIDNLQSSVINNRSKSNDALNLFTFNPIMSWIVHIPTIGYKPITQLLVKYIFPTKSNFKSRARGSTGEHHRA